MESQSIATVLQSVRNSQAELGVLREQILSNYENLFASDPIKNKFNSEIRNMKMEETAFNKEFEEEYMLYGGKTRRQTLQEFVFLFFYVACVIGIIAVTIYYYGATGGSAREAAKIFFICVFILLLITAILIRYA
jgi:hypothetical protein